MKRIFIVLIAALILMPPGVARAVNPDEVLDNPLLEKRAREISKELRCLVCQNQSIDDSDAELAKDLRVLVRERLLAGDSDHDVVDYVVSRYGDFVLLNPPFKGSTYVLWGGPIAFILIGIWAVVAFYRKRAKEAEAGDAMRAAKPLTAAEQKRLDKLLKDE